MDGVNNYYMKKEVKRAGALKLSTPAPLGCKNNLFYFYFFNCAVLCIGFLAIYSFVCPNFKIIGLFAC